jgi:hypothetical protein
MAVTSRIWAPAVQLYLGDERLGAGSGGVLARGMGA